MKATHIIISLYNKILLKTTNFVKMHEKETRNRQKEAIIDLQTKTCSVIMEKMNKNILLTRPK